jgi:hypothetical protein
MQPLRVRHPLSRPLVSKYCTLVLPAQRAEVAEALLWALLCCMLQSVLRVTPG